MENVLYAINIVLPLVLLVVLGYGLRKIGLISPEFVTGANKIVFYVAIPTMLFKSVYDATFTQINFTYIAYILGATIIFFLLGWLFYGLIYRGSGKVGTLVQALMRTNYTLIGMPLVMMIFTEGSGEYASTLALVSLVAAFFLPLSNILSVVALSICDPKQSGQQVKHHLKNAVIKIIKNPLIIGLFIGLVFSVGRALFFPGVFFIRDQLPFVYKAITYITNLASPLALIMVGAKFRFSATKALGKYILGAIVGKSIILPLLVYGVAILFFDFSSAEYAVFFAAFASPVAVSSVPVVEQMQGDSELGGQIVVYTTLLAPFVIVILLTLLKSLALL